MCIYLSSFSFNKYVHMHFLLKQTQFYSSKSIIYLVKHAHVCKRVCVWWKDQFIKAK